MSACLRPQPCPHPIYQHASTKRDGKTVWLCTIATCPCIFTETSGPTEDDGAGTATGTAVGAAAATVPAPSRHDPLTDAAYRVVTAADGPDTTLVVPLAVAQRIRDEAAAELNAELDSLYQALADTSRAITRHLPAGTDPPPSITAGIAAVADHAYAQGAAAAAGQIADAIGPIELDPVEHIGEIEEVDR